MPRESCVNWLLNQSLFFYFQAVKRACEYLKERMAPIAKAMDGAKWHELVQACFFQGVDLCARHM